MKTVIILGAVILFASRIFGQENVSFNGISRDDYRNGFLYLEEKEYKNSKRLAHKNRDKANKLPVIVKEITEDSIFYSFTGYEVTGSGHIWVIIVRAKFLNGSFNGNNIEIMEGLKLPDGGLAELVKTIESNETIREEGSDSYGGYSILKKLFYNKSSDIEELCKLTYAVIIKNNIERIPAGEISRQLYYYLLNID